MTEGMSEATELIPCYCARLWRKTITTDAGIVFVCQKCSHHWYRTYAQINATADTEGK